MGSYINPATESKEDFLFRDGEVVLSPMKWEEIPANKSLVCLVDNGFFTAAGIMYNEQELSAFANPGDNRPKTWFLVDTEKLYTVSDLKFYL